MEQTDFLRVLNTLFTVAMIGVGAGLLTAYRRPRSAYGRADRFSRGVRLPYGTDRIRDSIARAMRARTIAVAVAVLVGGLVMAALLPTPIGSSPFLIFSAMIPTLVVGTTLATVVVGVRERLFHPAPDAPRIARAREMTVGDYLPMWRRMLPWAIAAAAVPALITLMITWARSPEVIDSWAALCVMVVAGVTLLMFVALPSLDRLILAQAQPASDTLELAWDDALRTRALQTFRLSCALGAWFTLSLSLVTMWDGHVTGAMWWTQLPTWGLILLQFTYPLDGRRLPDPLYPAWLRRPAAEGGSL